jgi:hypothetical protein
LGELDDTKVVLTELKEIPKLTDVIVAKKKDNLRELLEVLYYLIN